LSIYADTSFFVSLYIQDKYSPEAQHRMAAKPDVWLTPLHVAEWIHAVEQHVFHKKMSPQESHKVRADFARDRANGVWIETGIPDTAFEICAELGYRYAARFGIRTLDTLHVAVATELKAEHFWTFDQQQAKLARAAGLKIR
jgi:predicted nucleic acid-binding protein